MCAALGACGSPKLTTTGPYGCFPRTGEPVIERSDDLVKGTLHLLSYPPVKVGQDVDWAIDPFDNSWKFAFHSMQYIYELFGAHKQTGRAIYLTRARALLADWAHDNVPTSRADFAWYPHAAAKRAQVIACAAARWKDNWIDELLDVHGRFLADSRNYEGVSNHGIDEGIGLLYAGCELRRRDWVETATDRLTDAITSFVDEEGVTNEQAVDYHHYDWVLFGRVTDGLRQCRQGVPSAVRRRDKIPTFLAHATRPDGKWEGLGDSYAARVKSIPATPLEYAASQGRSGSAPRDRVKVYRGGWVFGRTGWGTNRPFEDESFYSIRFGPSVRLHGHSDHTSLTYFAKKRTIITEAGFGGYVQDEFRTYEKGASGHNAVLASGAGDFRWDQATSLREWCAGDGWQRFELSGQPYTGVNRRRTILFVEGPEMFVVRDALSGPKGVTFRQLWHLPPDMKAEKADGRVVARAGRTTVQIVQVLPNDRISVVAGRKSPMQGWVAVDRSKRLPAPVMITKRRDPNAEFITVIGIGSSVTAKRTGSTMAVDVDGRSRSIDLGEGTLAPANAKGRCRTGDS